MSWSNQSGGGGRNNGGGGPWGGKPNGGGRNQGGGSGGGGGNPPNFEDIVKMSQDRLKNAVPGGGGSGIFALLIVAGALVIWAMNSFYTVEENEVGQELVFGKPKSIVSRAGFHFHWWPIETVEKVSIVERTDKIGAGSTQGLMLSGDQNIVDVDFTVQWFVSDPKKYLFNVTDPGELLLKVSEAAMREVVGRRPADAVFRDDRQGIASDVRQRIQSTLDGYGAGISVNDLNLENVAPPDRVADAFEEVQRAEQDEDRFRREAEAYANKKLGEANGRASEIREQAVAYKDRVVKEAEGEAQRFISIYDQYAIAQDVTKKRLFLETMERVLSRSKMVIMENNAGGGNGVIPYLPLDRLNQQRPAAQ